MLTGKDILSPLASGSLQRMTVTPQEFISPSSRRHVAVSSPGTYLSPDVINDDEAEKKERRRSKVLELQIRNFNSPAPSEKRQSNSTPLGGLSNNQLADYYADCIKLSTENKINSKNAFGLHLIDYMTDLVKCQEVTNFQVVSSTLDASAKIYAGRVDAIHSQAYKVLTGLGRGYNNQGPEDEGEDNAVEQTGKEGKNPKKKVRRRCVIEKNLKKLQKKVEKLQLEFDVDPLFQKNSAAFDDGGTGGLLINQLKCAEDNSQLIFDSSTIASGDDVTSTSQATAGHVDSKDLRDIYGSLNMESLQLCPTFADFDFTNWNKSSEDTISSMRHASTTNDHAFDLEAEVEPVPEQDVDNDDDDFGPIQDDDAVSVCPSDMTQKDQTMAFGDSSEAKIVKSAWSKIKEGDLGPLIQMLASKPSDYSYFKDAILQTWAGPAHWKLKARPKDAEQKPNKKKKVPFVIKYEEEEEEEKAEVDFDSYFKESRAATTLTKATLVRHSKAQTTLPQDLHDDGGQLFSLFLRSNVKMKRQREALSDVDSGIDDYNFENAKDRDNFCPADMGDGCEDDDYDNDGGFDLTAGAGLSSLEGTILSGDNLISQPRKVAKIDIAYAKRAKKIDVKRLKASMWLLLTANRLKATETKDKSVADDDNKNADEEENHTPMAPPGESESGDVASEHTFLEMMTDLPGKISKNMAENMSVPIAFVCLLHLTNEKNLSIKSKDNMTDLVIVQG